MVDGKHGPRRDEPALGPLVRGFVGLALSLGGLALGGETGRGLVIVGTLTTAMGGALFTVEYLVRWKRRRE